MNSSIVNRMLVCAFFLLTNPLVSSAQKNTWQFINGCSFPVVTAQRQEFPTDTIYPCTLFPSHFPGHLENAVTWTDLSGNLWMYGGQGTLANGVTGTLSVLWKFSKDTGQWEYVNGNFQAANEDPKWVTRGVPSDSAHPGGRVLSTTWVDDNGRLWLFGGQTWQSIQNDLWVYDILTNQWTWMSGDNIGLGIYGTQLVSSPDNLPGARSGSAGWKGADGNLYLFGGGGFGDRPDVDGALNDVWKYTINTGEWTWLQGGKVGRAGVTQFDPGGRSLATSWKDGQGNFWLYGGWGQQYINSIIYSDLWKFDVASNSWININQGGMSRYGIRGLRSPLNQPGNRFGSLGWADQGGNLWLFGGACQYNGSAPGNASSTNDVWRYSISTNEWTWINGDTTGRDDGWYDNYNARPRVRRNTMAWKDAQQNFWIFGGTQHNDMFRFVPVKPGENQPPVVYISSPAPGTSLPAGSTVTLNAQALDEDGTISKVAFYLEGLKLAEFSNSPYQLSGANIEAGTYKLTAKAFDNLGDSSVSDTITLTIVACTAAGKISAQGFTGIPGANVQDLLSNPAYPNNPSVETELSSMEYGAIADQYGARLRGYLCAPVTGDYIFYIAGDEQAGLWLSSDANPNNKNLIAHTALPTAFREWNKYTTQASQPVRLIAGAKYYIETLHKESEGDDHLSVGWKLPGQSGITLLPGDRLSPYSETGTGSIRNPKSFGERMIASAGSLTATVAPNPSSSSFTINVSAKSPAPISMQVLDHLGRVIDKNLQVTPGKIQLGDRWNPGIYFLEIVQGKERVMLKLVKL